MRERAGDPQIGAAEAANEVRRVSVVVPARNAAATLAEQLTAITAQRDAVEDLEVVVVDDGSEDPTSEVAARFDVAVIRHERRRGANAARNSGAQWSSGQLILFTDADDVVAPGWVAAMTTTLADADLAGGATVPLVPGTDARVQHELPLALSKHPYAIGSSLGVRRSAFDGLGGFDERWPQGATEVEFCWRAQLAGLRLEYATGAIVRRRARTTARGALAQAWHYGSGDARLWRSFPAMVSAGDLARHLVGATARARGDGPAPGMAWRVAQGLGFVAALGPRGGAA